jgi:nitronate monooxygenase
VTGTLRTPLCDLLHIEYPVLQSGMGQIAGPDLVAEVSRAGGLGILAGLGVPPDELRRRIRQVRDLTDRPFGVNLWLHAELRPPTDPATIPDETVRAVQGTLNRFRERLGVPAVDARPPRLPDLIAEQFEMILDERVPVWSIGLGDPGPEMVRRCRERGVKVVAMAARLGDAQTLARSGVDVIVAQGAEAGGHRSTWVKTSTPEEASIGLASFVPQVVDAVTVPVVASGGLVDGRGLVAALALGAQGMLLGTRFVATRESMAPEFYKRALLEHDGSATGVSDAFTGLYARAIRNRYAEEYARSGAPVLPGLTQRAAAQDVHAASAARQSGDYFPMWAGQGVGLIHDLPGAGDVVRSIAAEAEAVLAKLAAFASPAGPAERARP